MSANAEALPRSGILPHNTTEISLPNIRVVGSSKSWNLENYALEQIRTLVQRVFFAGQTHAIRKVVFTALGPETDVAGLCQEVAADLSTQTHSNVAVVGLDDAVETASSGQKSAIYGHSVQLTANLWRVSGFGLSERNVSGSEDYWLACMNSLRREFEYAVIQGPSAYASNEVAQLGKHSDGIVLVLDAHSTRKVIARKLKDTLVATQVRILGSVLSRRRFPMPYGIYRRL